MTVKIDGKMEIILGSAGAVFIWVMAGALVITISGQTPEEGGNLTDYSHLEMFPDENYTTSEGLLRF